MNLDQADDNKEAFIQRATDTGEPYEVDTVGSDYINKLHREGHDLRTQLAEALSLLAFHGHKIEAARNCGQLGMPQGDCGCSVCRSFFAERDSLRLLIEAKDKALKAQHDWHLAQTDRAPVYFGDTIGQVNADEYSDSGLFEQTTAALALTPDSLTEELRALREDKELLDWLEKQKKERVGSWECPHAEDPAYWRNPSVKWSISQSMKCGTYDIPEELKRLTLRDAIRNAKEGNPQQ